MKRFRSSARTSVPDATYPHFPEEQGDGRGRTPLGIGGRPQREITRTGRSRSAGEGSSVGQSEPKGVKRGRNSKEGAPCGERVGAVSGQTRALGRQ